MEFPTKYYHIGDWPRSTLIFSKQIALQRLHILWPPCHCHFYFLYRQRTFGTINNNNHLVNNHFNITVKLRGVSWAPFEPSPTLSEEQVISVSATFPYSKIRKKKKKDIMQDSTKRLKLNSSLRDKKD